MDNLSFSDKYNEIDFEKVDWSGPSGYSIVVPEGDMQAVTAAQRLRSFFNESGRYPDIRSDKSAPVEKEILIGECNRPEAQKLLDPSFLEVSVKNGKLVFSAGHPVILSSAVEKFIRLSRTSGSAVVFSQKTDFDPSPLDGYEYVWGDEFEGEDIDFTKWDFEPRMGGTKKCEISRDKSVVRVEEGKLKLHGIMIDDPQKPDTRYRVPVSLVSKYKMNFRYGYAEIRCRLPFFSGVWPSFWTQSTDVLSGEKKADFMAEVDVFEVFGKSENKNVVPGIIKWPHSGGHSFWCTYRETKKVDWTDKEGIEEEYHTYGWEWTPDQMVMYVDREKYMTFDLNEVYDGRGDMQGFHDPMFLILNNHLMAEDSWQPGSRIEAAEELLPSKYYVDWIRIYQKPDVGSIWINKEPMLYPGRE